VVERGVASQKTSAEPMAIPNPSWKALKMDATTWEDPATYVLATSSLTPRVRLRPAGGHRPRERETGHGGGEGQGGRIALPWPPARSPQDSSQGQAQACQGVSTFLCSHYPGGGEHTRRNQTRSGEDGGVEAEGVGAVGDEGARRGRQRGQQPGTPRTVMPPLGTCSWPTAPPGPQPAPAALRRTRGQKSLHTGRRTCGTPTVAPTVTPIATPTVTPIVAPIVSLDPASHQCKWWVLIIDCKQTDRNNSVQTVLYCTSKEEWGGRSGHHEVRRQPVQEPKGPWELAMARSCQYATSTWCPVLPNVSCQLINSPRACPRPGPEIL